MDGFVAQTVASFFADRLDAAVRQSQTQIEPFATLYLVDLLASFAHQSLQDAPQGVELMRACLDTPGLRIKHFKQVGDSSLMIAGAWPAQLRRKPVKIGYYVRLGRAGYANAAVVMRDHFKDEHFQYLFENLDENFELYRDLVEKVTGALGSP